MNKMCAHLRFCLVTALFFASLTLSAQDYTGKLYKIGEQVTELETGKMYFLYNNGSGKFAYEDTSGKLMQATSPEGLAVKTNLGFMFQLESADDSKYYIRIATDDYVPNPGSKAKEATESPYALKITQIADAPGHFLIAGNIYKLTAPANGSELIGGNTTKAGSVSDWSFINVEMTDIGNLKGRELYDYQMSEDFVIRLVNKRNPNYLTATTSGEAYGAAKANDGYSQLWVREKSGDGYTLFSAETGQYLQETFAEPSSSATTLYFQYSPNNTDTKNDSWCNISSEADFSGQKCLNLGNDGKTLYKWTYSGDSGSDWAMEIAEDITDEEIRQHLNEKKGWVSELEDGAYYRIVSVSYSKDMTELNGELKSVKRDETNLAQCWQLHKNGSGYTIQNVVSENYANGSPSTSQFYTVGKASKVFYITSCNDKWNNIFTIRSSVSDYQGMHTASSQSYHVVLWDVSADASKWAFEKVNLSQEEIDAARKQYSNYETILANKAAYQKTLLSMFTDKACTTLKSEIQAMSDEELMNVSGYNELPQDLKNMVLKVKNNTWQTFGSKVQDPSNTTIDEYEKFFRIADYSPYSNYNQICWEAGQSNCYGKLSGPTGIVANTGDILYIFVDQSKSSDCTLQLERVTTDGVPGDHQTGACTDLNPGLNIIRAEEQDMLYIFYQLNNTSKYLADYPDIKIHIEGGTLHGYWDATRGMTNQDWKLLQKYLLKECPHVNLKTNNLVFAVNASELIKACPTEMEGITKIWNTIVTNEEKFQGLEGLEGRLNNIWNVFTVNYNYMFATSFGTYYHENTMGTIFNFETMARGGGNLWGPSHEMGHNHQSTINMIGCMEVSNNLFSNINVWEHGTADTRGYNVETNFTDLGNQAPWLDRNIWTKTRLYLQLYFYFHAMKNDTTFYPRLFKELRKDPMIKRGNSSLGKEDYLHFAKKCCDIAQADLSEFFESYGFFIPISNYAVEDYANYIVNTTQSDIDAAKKYMQQYPRKLGNLMFINDKVERKPAEPNPDFCAIMPSDGLRYVFGNDDTSQWFLGKDQLGGDLESYVDNAPYDTSDDFFTVSGTSVSFKGSGWMGHKFYDAATGKLLWATNRKTDTLPLALRSLSALTDYYVVAAEANGSDVPCPYYKIATSAKRYKHDVYFGTEESKRTWYTNADGPATYLPENAIAVFSDQTNAITEKISATTNVVNGKDITASDICINGNLPFYMPIDVTAQNISFSKDGNGYNTLVLPFDIQGSGTQLYKTEIIDNTIVITPTDETISSGSPVTVYFEPDGFHYTAPDTKLNKGTFQPTEQAYILSKDGKSIISSNATPFTYTFPKQYNVDFATGISTTTPDSQASTPNSQLPIYSITGQRVQLPTKSGIYIQNGKKYIQ